MGAWPRHGVGDRVTTAHVARGAYAGDMSEPAPELPELEAEDALRGVVNQLVINGERMPVIIPGSVIEALRVLGVLLANAQGVGRLLSALLQAMPWARVFSEEDLSKFASDLTAAANADEHAPERLAAVMREWRETAEILADPEAMAALAEADEAIARGDVIRGTEAVRALRPRR